jgi:hypothetical protein
MARRRRDDHRKLPRQREKNVVGVDRFIVTSFTSGLHSFSLTFMRQLPSVSSPRPVAEDHDDLDNGDWRFDSIT